MSRRSYISPPTSSDKASEEYFTAPETHLEEEQGFKTPTKQKVKEGSVIPSSSPQYTPIDFGRKLQKSILKRKQESSPTKRNKNLLLNALQTPHKEREEGEEEEEDDICLIRRVRCKRGRLKPRVKVISSSQWWEEEIDLRPNNPVIGSETEGLDEELDDEDVEAVLNTESEYDDTVEMVRDSFDKYGKKEPSSNRLIKRECSEMGRNGGILTLLND